jgi:hypothetical protein
VAENSLLTVAGAAMALRVTARTTFPFDPLREPPRLQDEITAKLCQAANAASPQNPCTCDIPVLEQKMNEGSWDSRG